jgi:hypothetical protein
VEGSQDFDSRAQCSLGLLGFVLKQRCDKGCSPILPRREDEQGWPLEDFTHIPGYYPHWDRQMDGSPQGEESSKGFLPPGKHGGCILSLIEKYSTRPPFLSLSLSLTHTHTHTHNCNRAQSCKGCEESHPAWQVLMKVGASSHSKLPRREEHSSPTPDFTLHQVLPSTASPNTSKEVFLYSPGRSVNWPAASKAQS